MSVQDLASYHFQLSQVSEALERDPENSELIKLQSDLKELISLAEKLYSADRDGSRSTASEKKKNNKSTGGTRCKWFVGQTVKAKWKDGKFYTAIVETLADPSSGSDSRKAAVRFEEFADVEYVDLRDIRESGAESKATNGGSADDILKQHAHNNSVVIPNVPVTPATTAAISNSTTRPKKKYKPKNPNSTTKADSYQASKQQAWLSFLSSGSASSDGPKSSKRKAPVAPLVKPIPKKQSMFSTSDHPTARVGVIGSGKPMTQFHQRGKHIFPLKT